MANQAIGFCPVCNEKLMVKTFKCNHCNTEVSGDFELSPVDYLTKDQKDFALVFIKCQGNIKDVEKTLGISYPTVKKNLDDLCNALNTKTEEKPLTREEIKRKLKNKEISFEEAEKLLGGEL